MEWEQWGGGFCLGVVHPAFQDVRRHAPSLVHCLVGAHVVDGIAIKELKGPVFHGQEFILLYDSHLPANLIHTTFFLVGKICPKRSLWLEGSQMTAR